jgi:hypothetical protein
MLGLGKGDVPSASASAKDIQREKAIDAQLKDPPNLPTYLQEHGRRTSRIDVDVCCNNGLTYILEVSNVLCYLSEALCRLPD